MPKIIQIINTRRDALLALDDSGQLFAYSPEIAGLSVESWQRIPLLSEHMPPVQASGEYNPPPPSPVTARIIRPDWATWLSDIHRKSGWFVCCPRCKCNIQSTDTASLHEHWMQGHFDCETEIGLTGE